MSFHKKTGAISASAPSVALFFELIQVSLGVRYCLSGSPSGEEWKALYAMAVKQTVTGICFSGVQKLSKRYPEQTAQLPMGLRMQWLAMTAAIQRQNEMMNQRCAELQEIMEKDGMSACVLKGQGIATLYHSLNEADGGLALLRQPGDIDVWVRDTDILKLTEYLHSRGLEYCATAAHVECNFFKDAVVEFHARPAFFRNFHYNRRLQRWCDGYDWEGCREVNGCLMPSDSFNLVFLLVHLYHHFLYEGVGLRQLMDYWVLLHSISADDRGTLYDDAMKTLKSFGMLKFVRGVMSVMQEVFMMPDEMMLCELDRQAGELILEDMLESGNMGKYHNNKTAGRDNPLLMHWTNFKRNLEFLSISPAEILSYPLWSLWHWGWRKCRL